MGACCGSGHASEPSTLPPYMQPAPVLHTHFHQQTAQQQGFLKPSNSFEPSSPFLLMRAPNGMRWGHYVQQGGSYIDGVTLLLAGPWAECICWGVHFEHTNDWQRLPEFAAEGPAGGILSAFATSIAARGNSHDLLSAAERLEEAAHAAAENGHPLPVIHCRAGEHQPWQGASMGLAAPGSMSAPAAPYPHGEPGCAFQPHMGPGQPMGYSETPHMYGGGPTLLQQPTQNQSHTGGGMGDGAKMALAAAGGVAAGVGGYYLATHMDDVGDFVGGAVEDVGDFMEGAAEGVGDFVDDIF